MTASQRKGGAPGKIVARKVANEGLLSVDPICCGLKVPPQIDGTKNAQSKYVAVQFNLIFI